jgi:hypothetical protein
MAVFPQTASGVNDLAMTMINGLDQHAELFPSVTLAIQTSLDQSLSGFQAAANAQMTAKAAAKTATIAKDDAQGSLEEEMLKVLKLAEYDCAGNPANLDYIGWGPRKEPSPLSPPAQPRELQAIKEGPGVLTLTWLKPVGGGAISSYRIERSEMTGGGMPGAWVILTNCYGINITLSDQPRMIELQYRVIATNAAGDSMPSNIATAVL